MNMKQRGATLIVVLMLLIAIIIIGTLAVRQSLVSLNIATNSQAQQLFLQNSDASFFNAEKTENLVKSFATNGMFGYISGPTNVDKELVFCFKGSQSQFFDIDKASLIYWQAGGIKPNFDSFGIDGYCKTDDTTGDFFTSGRKVIITQVAVKFSSKQDASPFYGLQKGTDDKTVKFEKAKPVKIFTVSIIPSLTSVAKSSIDACLKEHMHEVTIPEGTTGGTVTTKQSVTDCLETLNVPFTSQVSEYMIAQDFE